MGRKSHIRRKIIKRRLEDRIKFIERNPSSGRYIDHDPHGNHTPEACKRAIEEKGIQPGIKVKIQGETIPRPVEAILDDFRIRLSGFFAPAYPTEVQVIS